MNRTKRNIFLTAAVAATLVMLTALSVYAAHPRARDSVVIHVRIFPKQAEAVPIRTPWNVTAVLAEERLNQAGIKYRTIGSQSAVADANGQLTFVLPTHADSTNVRRTYRIACIGGWAYHTGSSQHISASSPGEHTVSINMRRK